MPLTDENLLALVRVTSDLLELIREAVEDSPANDRALNAELTEFATKAEAALRMWHHVRSQELDLPNHDAIS
jgi:hypothetical protein